ncbi:unnamed protein product, partial [Choristocarpus tenellus]
QINGTTPLHAAAGHLCADYIPIIVLLLHYGADVEAVDARGKTPIDITTSPQVAALLGEHALRLERQQFTMSELRLGQEVLTHQRSNVGGPGLWRYLIGMAIANKLNDLNLILEENGQTPRFQGALPWGGEVPETTGGSRTEQGLNSASEQEPVTSAGNDNGKVLLGEHELEVVRIHIERLEAARSLVEKEHTASGGGWGGSSTTSEAG